MICERCKEHPEWTVQVCGKSMCVPCITERINFLEEQLRRIYRVGHTDDCLFCGFKDRQVLESNVFNGTEPQSAELVGVKARRPTTEEAQELNEAERLEDESNG